MSMATGATGTAQPAGKGSQSVLVVEDDPGLATQLVRGLTRGGYSVDHVMTGREALASGPSRMSCCWTWGCRTWTG